jgi:hypothetical protein
LWFRKPSQSLDTGLAHARRLASQMLLNCIPDQTPITRRQPLNVLNGFRREQHSILHSGHIIARLWLYVKIMTPGMANVSVSSCPPPRRADAPRAPQVA